MDNPEDTENRSIGDLYPEAIRFYQVNSVSYKNEEVTGRLASIAKPFYEAFAESAEQRQADLKTIFEKLDPGPVVVTTFNEGFIELFRNWVASCDHHEIAVRNSTVVFPTDQPSNDIARSLGFHTWFQEGAMGPLPREAASVYADRTFVLCMFAKNAAVQAVLSLGRDILFQDIDMVWLKDPRPWLTQQVALHKVDFQFMYDGYNPRFQPLYYNSGFIYIVANEFSRVVWQVLFNSFDKVLHYRSQQVPVNIIMNTFRERGLRTRRLPEDLFVNGHLTPLGASKDCSERLENAYVMHSSWTHNLDKKYEKLREYNLWYLETPS